MSRFRAALASLTAAALLTAGSALAVALGAAAGEGVQRFEVRLAGLRDDGGTVELRLEVAAPSRAAAEAEALRGALSLAPHTRFWLPGEASAAWRPWPWLWDASEIPVPVAYNPAGAPEIVGPDAVVAALQAWSNVEGSSFRYSYAGITDNTASILELGPDGENVVSWATLDCAEGCVLGITSKESAHEVDLLLNNNPQAAELLGVGTTVDWRTVILHELGHMAGLEHSCPVPFGPCTEAEADAVMYFQYRGILRKLAPDDIAGLAALYPLVPPTPGPTPPGPSPTPTPYPESPVVLEKGWNLVLLPPGPAANVAGGLSCVRAIYTEDDGEWVSYIPGVPDRS